MATKKNSNMKLIMENWRGYRISSVEELINEFLSSDSGYPAAMQGTPNGGTSPEYASQFSNPSGGGDIASQAEDILMKALAEFEDIENWGQKGREIQKLYKKSVATLDQTVNKIKDTGLLSKSTSSSLDSFSKKIKETKGRAASLTTILVLTKMLDLIEEKSAGGNEQAIDAAVKEALTVSANLLEKVQELGMKSDGPEEASTDDEVYNQGVIDQSRRRSGYLMKYLNDVDD